eukprot:15444700-Alexandrium_andersonii.AAC.1
MGSNGARVLAGGAEVAPRCRLGGGRDSGPRPGGISGPPDMAGVSGYVNGTERRERVTDAPLP